MTPGALFDRAAARSLEFVQAGVRRVPKRRRASLTQRLKPSFDRLLDGVSRPELRDGERALAASITDDPRDAALWYQLGLHAAARGRNRRALDAWMTSAELGRSLDSVALAVLSHPSVRAVADTERTETRIRRIADTTPDSAETQLLAGAFLLDLARLEPGRALVDRGYDLLFDDTRRSTMARDLSPSRPGPDFLMLGPAKTGSSSLYAYLTEHPGIVPAPRKELQFWRYRYGRAVDDYAAYFPTALPLGSITGEASTNTLTALDAVPYIRDRYPGVKVIVLHRDPVARTYSEFQMQRRSVHEGRSFERLIGDELRRNGDHPPIETGDLVGRNDGYLLRSCILPYLRSWVAALGPEHVMVVESDALATRRQATVDAVCEFLGLVPQPIAEPRDRNVHHYDPIPAAAAQQLERWFAPHESALDEFLSEQPILTFGR